MHYFSFWEKSSVKKWDYLLIFAYTDASTCHKSYPYTHTDFGRSENGCGSAGLPHYYLPVFQPSLEPVKVQAVLVNLAFVFNFSPIYSLVEKYWKSWIECLIQKFSHKCFLAARSLHDSAVSLMFLITRDDYTIWWE